jgi:ubiquinone/menaquinone biosynthesis C-methylase UbiE
MFQTQHAALPIADHDEFAREEFCGTLRRFFTTQLWPANTELYRESKLPEFEQRHGRAPQSRQEIVALMEETFYYRATCLLGRTTQEVMWDTVSESIARQADDLKQIAAKPGTLGTLTLAPDMQMPTYISAVDIHAMPGNFQTELSDGDVMAGALYDRGVYVFAFGGLGALNDGLGQASAHFVKDRFPDLKPKRILDVGCGPGFTTLPWKQMYPDAEVYGIDVGAPTVRYAHARAESLGVAAHFVQGNGADTQFPDGFFDIVSSMLVLHECPFEVNKALFREAHRILAPGGVMVHDGYVPSQEPWAQFIGSWFTYNANEPFSVGLRKLDYKRDFTEAGFPEGGFFSGQREAVYLKGQLPPVTFAGAVKA